VKHFGQPKIGLAFHQSGSRLHDEFLLGNDRRLGQQLLTQAEDLSPL